MASIYGITVCYGDAINTMFLFIPTMHVGFGALRELHVVGYLVLLVKSPRP